MKNTTTNLVIFLSFILFSSMIQISFADIPLEQDDDNAPIIHSEGVTNADGTFIAYYDKLSKTHLSALPQRTFENLLNQTEQQKLYSKIQERIALLNTHNTQHESYLHQQRIHFEEARLQLENNIITPEQFQSEKMALQKQEALLSQLQYELESMDDLIQKITSVPAHNLYTHTIQQAKQSTPDVLSKKIQIQNLKDAVLLANNSFEQSNITFHTLQDNFQIINKTFQAGNITLEQLQLEKQLLQKAQDSLQIVQDNLYSLQENLYENMTSLKISKHVTNLFTQVRINSLYTEHTPDTLQIPRISLYVKLHQNALNSDILNNYTVITRHESLAIVALTEAEIIQLSKSNHIQSIDMPDTFHLSATSQGVAKSFADTLHMQNINGTNSTVAIIDDSFVLSDPKIMNNIINSALFDSEGECGGDILCGQTISSHGTATAQIVVDMAPAVNLELYAISNSLDFLNVINYIIQNRSVDAISISLSFPTVGGDGTTGHFRDGTSDVAKAVDAARDAGILVAVSAGNAAQKHWSGNYTLSSISPSDLNLNSINIIYQSVMEFQPTASGLKKACLPTTNNEYSILTWNAWDNTMQDYDLFLYDDSMSSILSSSIDSQLTNPESIEVIYDVKQSGCLVVASYNSSQNHLLHIYAINGSISNGLAVSSGSISTPADAQSVMATGAVHYNTLKLESFSSRGPTDDGRLKPDICGYDGVASLEYGTFSGTSAAAPHIAGSIALIKQINPQYTADDIELLLLNNAINNSLSTPNMCGAGLFSLSGIDPSPVIIDVSSTMPNGIYGIDTIIDIIVNFSRPVTITGTPQLTLNLGNTNKTINYTSGTNTNTITFQYIVQSGENSADLDYTATNSLTLNNATITDGPNNASIVLPEPSSTGSLGANKNIIIDTTPPRIINVSSNTLNGTYGIGQKINVTVLFSENVTITGTPQLTLNLGNTNKTINYTSGTNTNTITFQYIVQSGDNSSFSYTVTTITLNNGLIQDYALNDVNFTLPAFSINPPSENRSIIIDGIIPTIQNVSSDDNNATYVLNNIINITVLFSENVTITGTPYITLETGVTDRKAYHTSGNNTDILTFQYIVQSGDNSDDLNYHTIDALTSNGTIQDYALNDANLTLPALNSTHSLASNKNITIDGIVPTILSSTLSFYNSTFSIEIIFTDIINISQINLTRIFASEAGTSNQMSLNGSTIHTSFNATIIVINITENQGNFISTLNTPQLDIQETAFKDTSGNIVLQSSDNLLKILISESVNILNSTLQTIEDITAPTNSEDPIDTGIQLVLASSEQCNLDIQYTKNNPSVYALPVNLVVASLFADISGCQVETNSTLLSSRTIIMTYTDQMLSRQGGIASDLQIYRNDGTSWVILNAILDTASKTITANPPSFSPFVLAINPTVNVTQVTSIARDGTYGTGNTIDIQIHFSKPVTVTGTPQLLLETGIIDRTANFVSGTSILTFQYIVQLGDKSSDLDYTGINSLVLNGGSITGSTSAANLTLPLPGSINSLAANKNIVLDASASSFVGSSGGGGGGGGGGGSGSKISTNIYTKADVSGVIGIIQDWKESSKSLTDASLIRALNIAEQNVYVILPEWTKDTLGNLVLNNNITIDEFKIAISYIYKTL